MNGKIRVFNVIATALAAGVGLIALLGYFVRLDVLLAVRLGLVSLVSVLAAWAVLAGTLNLLIAHGKKFMGQAPGWFYSIFVLLGFSIVILGNAAVPLLDWGQGAANEVNTWLLTYVISAGGAALAGVIAFFLVYAGYRMLRRAPRTPPNTMVIFFLVTTVLALLVMAPWPADTYNPELMPGTTLRDVLNTLTQVPAIGGARGLLLGIALGVVATGLRVLLGLDRPYGN